jgi:hypothetical protein
MFALEPEFNAMKKKKKKKKRLFIAPDGLKKEIE